MAVALDRAVFSKLSASSKILGSILLLGYIVIPVSKSRGNDLVLNNLALVAGKTLPFGCWNVVTSAFVENSATSVRPLTCFAL